MKRLQSFVLSTLLSGAAFAQGDANVKDGPPYLEIKGSAEIAAPNDMVTIGGSFDAYRDTADEAQFVAAEKAGRVLAELRRLGFADADIRVYGPSTSRRYAKIKNPKGGFTIDYDKPLGFGTSVSIQAETNTIPLAQKAMSAVSGMGLALKNPSFRASTKPEAELACAEKAATHAMTQAERTLRALGSRVGRLLYVTDGSLKPIEQGEADLPSRKSAPLAEEAPVDFPLQPGGTLVQCAIWVRVEILPAK